MRGSTLMEFTFQGKGEEEREAISMFYQHRVGGFEEAFGVGVIGTTRDLLVAENWG